eukprot:g5182.t1
MEIAPPEGTPRHGGHEEYAVGEVDTSSADDFYDPDDPEKIRFEWWTLWRYTGPGWLMSMAYLDPGNLTSDLQQGAYTEYQLLWVLWWSTVAGWVLQVLSARLGVVTGMDLAQVCRREMPRWVVHNLFFQIELAVIGADIQEVLGSAVALRVLFGIPLWGGCLITAVTTFSFLGVQKYGVRLLEAFFAFFIGIMTICFMINWGEAHTEAGPFMFGWVVPDMSAYALLQAVGIVGAVIMPHNLYLHSGLVLSRKIGRDRSSPRDVHKMAEGNFYNKWESAVALFVSFWINAAIVATFAAKFYDSDCAATSGGPYACVAESSINRAACDGSDKTCSEAQEELYGTCNTTLTGLTSLAKEPAYCTNIGLLLAGEGLEGTMGSAAKYVWGIGLLAAGQAATMTATYAGQFVFAGFIKLELPMWAVMSITRAFALGPSVVIALLAGDNPGVSAQMNEWLNTLQSIQLPFAILPVMVLTNKKRIMGRFVNGYKTMVTCWLLALLLIAVNTYFIIEFLIDPSSPLPHHTWFYVVVCLYGVYYYGLIFYLVRDELFNFYQYLNGSPERRDSTICTEPYGTVKEVPVGTLQAGSVANNPLQPPRLVDDGSTDKDELTPKTKNLLAGRDE